MTPRLNLLSIVCVLLAVGGAVLYSNDQRALGFVAAMLGGLGWIAICAYLMRQR